MKVRQELDIVYYHSLFLLFLDLRKSYDTIDRDRLIRTLEKYGAVPRLCGLLKNFWSHQNLVPIHNGYRGPVFPSTPGTTQGSLISMTLFNVVVENIIWTWLAMTVEGQKVAHNGMVEAVVLCLGFFYANDSMVGSRDA